MDSSKSHDIHLWVAEDQNHYYINRAMETDSMLFPILEGNMNKAVGICYAKHWSLLDPYNKNRHVYSVVIEGDTIYSEF